MLINESDVQTHNMETITFNKYYVFNEQKYSSNKIPRPEKCKRYNCNTRKYSHTALENIKLFSLAYTDIEKK